MIKIEIYTKAKKNIKIPNNLLLLWTYEGSIILLYLKSIKCTNKFIDITR